MKTGSPGANSTYASLSTALQAKLVSGLCPSQHVAAGILSLSLKKNHSFSELQGSQSPFVTWLCTEPPPRGSLESTQARTYYHLISFRWNLTFLFYTLSQVLLKYSWTWEPLSHMSQHPQANSPFLLWYFMLCRVLQYPHTFLGLYRSSMLKLQVYSKGERTSGVIAHTYTHMHAPVLYKKRTLQATN